MLQIKVFTFNNFGENTILVVDSETRQAIVVDPGMTTEPERREFDQFVKRNDLTITQVVNTHLHLDHCFGDNYVSRTYGVKIAAHIGDAKLGRSLVEQAASFHQRGVQEGVEIDVPLSDGDYINVGNGRLKVIHLPGHTPGGIALYDEADGWVIAGDSLFRGSIGRTDLPGGNYAQFVRSISDKLMTLPGNTLVIPGHGPRTTIDAERRGNPYL